MAAPTPVGPPDRGASSVERRARPSTLDAPRSTLTPKARKRVLAALLFAASSVPALYLGWQFWRAWNYLPSDLGKDPVKGLEHATGETAIRFLVLTLAVTPLRQLTGWNWLAPFRRQLGLWMAFYATTHLATFYALDLEGNLGEVATEIVKRPYITVGFVAWLLLLPLVLTSTTASIRRLGGKRWNRLHQLTYVVVGLGMLHYFWSQKKDVTDPLLFAAVFAALFAWRGWRAWQKRGGAVVPTR
ncbi:protein-methionine-sulfoxide reductase heme-binding subunit MsrQ [Roseisolibacter sp. H3M3-2]|uniref:sulfite oxidase heme-binding subunit YedZ n=1 Tax=Roseisolibacter sp. H3M3-2 TaxID=3031323 RepID=UPI0023DB3F15|nr:protein-methionine-sulfoxide reductase heme-binding subunit MsrQ [Roseisolibacter sp. H3M3-2]MDF1505519.1 sulfoxide reductase heme-binding subunit YedZ [Roseisolibacter sp. H3M3-2]